MYFFYLSSKYPVSPHEIDWHGKTVNYDSEKVVCEKVKTKYPIEDRRPYIIFIGSSQTWGAGASSPENAYPAIVEKKLRSHFRDTSITVINTGICGLTSKELYQFYEEQWCLHHPVLTVIDLSANDVDTVAFRQYIRRFLEFNESNRIKTLLIAEPTLPDETSSIRLKHNIMKSEGDRFNVKTVDMETYMNAYSETGFLCWDMVHFTDYGYGIFANGIAPEIIQVLEKDSSLMKFNRVK